MSDSSSLRIIDLLTKYGDICTTVDSDYNMSRVEKYRYMLVLMVDSYIGRDQYHGCTDQIDDYVRVIDVLRDESIAAVTRLNIAAYTYDRYVLRI